MRKHVFIGISVVPRHQHCGEDNRMKNYVIFADKRNVFRIVRLPIFFPQIRLAAFFGKFLRRGNITEHRFKPNVKNFSFGVFKRNFHAPIEVARNGSVGQTFLEPTATVVKHVIFPIVFFGIFSDIFFQSFLKLAKRKIPMRSFTKFGSFARDFRFRINQFRRFINCAALFALVASRFFVTAFRTSSFNVSVGQKLLRFRVVKL